MLKKFRLALLALAAASSFGLASAATSTATMGVSIVVQAGTAATSCSVTAPSINLNYTVGSASNYGATAYINISCDGNLPTPYTLSVDSGQNAVGTTRRAISAGGSYLNYNLTQFNGMGVGEFYSASGSTSPVPPSANTISSIYLDASISAGQTPIAGTYTDSLTVTLTY